VGLRERYSFRARELRATGEALRDQFQFLLRAGFDAFEVKKPADAGVFAEAAARFSVFYQRRWQAAGAAQSASAQRNPGTNDRLTRPNPGSRIARDEPATLGGTRRLNRRYSWI
jgi:hypothetical protein